MPSIAPFAGMLLALSCLILPEPEEGGKLCPSICEETED